MSKRTIIIVIIITKNNVTASLFQRERARAGACGSYFRTVKETCLDLYVGGQQGPWKEGGRGSGKRGQFGRGRGR
jgi:hypothetical protein